MNNYKKKQRQNIIGRIISDLKIHDQNQLIKELNKRKIYLTQATISRDLAEMGVIKVRSGNKKYKLELSDKMGSDVILKRLEILFLNFVSELKGVANQIIILTSPGNAHGVASFIDKLKWPNILGTIAGDDTILIITSNQVNRKIIQEKFQNILSKNNA